MPSLYPNQGGRIIVPARLRFLFITAFIITLCSTAQATNYYVSPSGSDANSGTSTTAPWQTLSKVAATVFSPGDTIRFICGGVWSGKLTAQGSGVSGNPIVIDMYGTGNKPLINGPGTNNSAAVYLVNQSYWEVNNLELTNTQATGDTARLTGVLVQNTGSTALNHLYVKNCYIHDVNAVGIGSSNYSKGTGGVFYSGWINDALVKGCHVANVQVEGIRNSSSTMCDHFVIDSNLIENVYGDGIVLHGAQNGSAITHNTLSNVCMNNQANFAGAWTYLSNQTLVAYNEVYGIKGGEGSNDGQSFDADISTNGDIFEYNYSHDNRGGFMLFMPSATNIIVRYNVSVNDCVGGSILKLFNYTATSTTNKIYNNTFYLANTINEVFQSGFNGTFNNNIVYSPGTVKQFSTAAISSSSVFSNNCFYPSSITNTNGPAGTVTGNIYVNPLFVRPGFDSLGMNAPAAYTLETTSPCRNTGVLMNGNGGVDYFGTTLPTGNPDMGAIQHTDTSTIKQVTVGTVADSYVRDGTYASTNYGTATAMVVKADATGYNRISYMKFDYSAFTDTASSSATLKFYVPSANTDATRTISVYGITDTTWGETTITWNNMPTAGTKLGTVTVSNQAGQWYQFDASSYIQSNMATKKVSFRLVNEGTPSASNDFSINSKEAASNGPQLTIVGKQQSTTTTTSDTVTTIADAYVRDGSYAGTNFGTATTMVVKADATGYNRVSYMKFAFADTALTTATLRFYVPGANTATSRVISVYGITDTTWGETSITWNNMPTVGTKLGTITVTNQVGVWYSFDVTSYIQSNLAAKKVSFRLINEGTPGSTTDFSINSKEAASNRPQLIISKTTTGPNASTVRAMATAAVETLGDGSQMLIYPNPVKGTATIVVPKAEGVIRMVDINGAVRIQLPVTGTRIKADIHDLLPGVYFVNQVTQGRIKSTQKMIVLP